jgi:hypothetical protein
MSAPPAYPRKGRTATVAAVVAAIAAVVAVALVAVTLLTRGDPPPNQAVPTPGPTITGEPPTDLRLRDDGGAVTLTWTDATAGTVPFIVAAGRTGEQLQLMATVNPGDTDFTADDLNARLDYCFTVLAVYGTDRYAPTNQICTTRTSPSPR